MSANNTHTTNALVDMHLSQKIATSLIYIHFLIVLSLNCSVSQGNTCTGDAERCIDHKQFKYKSDDDKNGIIHYLGNILF